MVKGCDICGSSIKEGKYNQSIYICENGNCERSNSDWAFKELNEKFNANIDTSEKLLIDELILMPIENRRQQIEFLKLTRISAILDNRIREKVRLANSLLTRGVRINQYYLSYVQTDKMPAEATGKTYEVFYKDKLIGIVSKFEQGWVFVEDFAHFKNPNLPIYPMRKKAVDTFYEKIKQC
ncbi:hypothetical protein [Bacillus mycoides]|uniref:hypothetical protein n=1 Tax=Bacillus mycoides TaxID=1405 RepID=UPI001F089CFC|nr:hypothetical protein [Bacillus mycoides]